jgi:WD40 repeat protein/tetratricopeptide (TPR) repeat protein
MGSATQVRIFFSSPGDVKMERETARRIVDRLQGEIGDRMTIEPYFWEHEVMVATKDYQENIPEMDGFDIVVCVLWSRLGTPLHPNRHPRPDGGFFESGTEYEFFTAMQAHNLRGTPDIFVFRNSTEPRRPSRPKEAREAVDREVDRLDHFFERYFQEEQYFTGAVNVYSTLGEFEDKLTLALRSFIEGRHPQSSAGKSPRKSQYAGLPYLGLAAFDFKDAPVFFGRTAQIGEVVEAFQTQELDAEANDGAGKRFVLILGSSGSGKSSLARAGVLPMLVQPGVIEGSQAWRRVIFKPGDAGGDPFAAFAAALLAPEALPELGSAGTTSAEIAALIRTEGGGGEILLRQALAQAGASARAEEKTRLLESVRKFEAENRETDAFLLREKIYTLAAPVVRLAVLADQLEELFTTGISDEVIAAFIDRLAALATSGRVFVLGTLRSDFYPRCLEHPKLVELMRGSGTYALPAPAPGDLGQMIRQPAAAAGLAFEENRATGEKLDELLRDAAIKDPGALPLLSYTLEQLYERRTADGLLTLAAYHDLGGLEGAIGRRAEAIFAALPIDAQAAFDPVWRQLVTLSESSEPVRRRAAYEALTQSPGAIPLVDALTAARLLTIDQAPGGGGGRSVSVAHEALLRHWPRVVDWVQENLDFLRARSRMAGRLSEWLEHASSDDYLIPSGPPLSEAEGILAKHERSLDAREIDFVKKSAARARRHDQARLRRARLIAAGAVVLSILAIAGGVFALFQSKAANRERVAAVQQKVIAEDAAKAALASQTRAAYLLGIEMLEAGKSREGLTSLAQALTLAPDHAGARDRLYSYHLYGLPKAIPIRSVAAPDGKRQRISGAEIGPTEICAYLTNTKAVEAFDLVTKKVIPGPWEQEPDSLAAIVYQSSKFIFNLRNDNTGRLWNIESKKASPPIHIGDGFAQLGFTDDGRWFIEGTQQGKVLLWNFDDGRLAHEWQQKGAITSAVSAADCRLLAVASDELVFYDLEHGKEIARVFEAGTTFRSAKISADGTVVVAQQVAAGDKPGNSHFKFYKAATGELLESRALESAGDVFDFAVNRDGTAIALADFSSSAKIRHRDDEKSDRSFPFDTYPVNVCFSPDERLLIAASSDGTVRIFDSDKQTQVFEPISHDGRLEDLHISWDGRYLLTGTAKQARIWDLSVGRALTLPLEQAGRSEGGTFAESSGNFWLASTSGIQSWDSRQLEKASPALLAGREPWDVLFDRAARRLAARSGTDRLLWLDTNTKEATPAEWKSPGEINWQALSPDGKIAAATVGDTVFLIDSATGKPIGEPWKIAEPITGITFSGDGKRLIVLTGQKLHLFDLTGHREAEISLPRAALNTAVASADGRWLAVSAGGIGMAVENSVLIWDLASPTSPPRRLPHGDSVMSLAFSDDSRLLATGSRDQYAEVWSPETGEPLSDPIFHPANVVMRVVFSPDGRLLATACGNQTVRVWDWAAAKPASGIFETETDVTSLKFSPDGRKLLAVAPSTKTAANFTLARVWEISPSAAAPVDLIALTEAATAQKVSATHLPAACDPFESWQRIRQQTPDSWFLQPPGSRSISPNFTAPSRRWITDSTTGVDALLLSMPSVGVVNAAVAGWKERELNKDLKALEGQDPKSDAYKTEYARLAVIYRQIEGLVETAGRNAGIDPWTSYYLSLQAESADHTEVARKHIEKALALEPENPEFLNQASDIYFALSARPELIPVVRKLRVLEPENDRHLSRLAFALWNSGEKSEALELFKIALTRPGTYIGDRASMLLMMGRPAEALPIYTTEADKQKAASADQKYSAESLLNLIAAHQLTGDSAGAVEFYREFIAAIPGTADEKMIAGLSLGDEFKTSLLQVLRLTLAKYPELAPAPAKD